MAGYYSDIFSLVSPLNAGSWCNTDDSWYFHNYSQTTLTLQTTDDVNQYNAEEFLVFSSINTVCVFHTYPVFMSAPLGLTCTLVVIGTQNGQLYSDFVPITITSNMTVNFSLSPTTTSALTSQLSALN